MKSRMLLLAAAIFLCAPFSALADTVTFFNTAGNLVSNSTRTTISLQSSALTGIGGLSAFGIPDQSVTLSSCSPTCLGAVAFTTGTKATGFLFSPTATFNAGGTITVTGTNFTFSGQFAAGATWTCNAVPGAMCNAATGGTWFFNGTVVGGMLTINGQTFMISTAATVQLTTSGKAPTGGTTGPLTWGNAGGTTTFAAPVPEPGTLGLVGGGLLGVSLFSRRRSPNYRVPS